MPFSANLSMHLKHDNLHFMFTCKQRPMIVQYKCSVEWLFVWLDRCYFIRTVNGKSMHWHLQDNWWSCRYFSTFIDSRERERVGKKVGKRDDKISTNKTTWSEQRSEFPKSSPFSYLVWRNILLAFYQHPVQTTLYLLRACANVSSTQSKFKQLNKFEQ